MYTDSGKKFIEITFLSNFELKFEGIIIFFKFCPRFARTRVFSRHIFPAYHKIPKISPGAYIFQRSFLRGLYLEGRFNGGFFSLPDWGASISRGLYMDGLIFGILRYFVGFFNLFFFLPPSFIFCTTSPKRRPTLFVP